MSTSLFSPYQLGPITLRNRTIRSAAFENMAYHNAPSEDLYNYHVACAKGGVGMTTIAYCSPTRQGASFVNQLIAEDKNIPAMRRMTDAIHAEGAKVSIQLGHCGNMTHFHTCGGMPVSSSWGINIYAYTPHRALKVNEIHDIAKSFGDAVDWARKCGIDCVEIHCGHAYLIGQFLSPYNNHRHDEYGGSLENRMRFMNEVLDEVMKHAGNDMAVVVKANMYDGFKQGLQVDDCITIFKEIEKHGVHAIIPTAGTVSKTPFTVMAGGMPIKSLTYYMNPWVWWWLILGLKTLGRWMCPTVPFKENFFLDTAKRFRKEVKLPLIYVGGIMSKANADEALAAGFDAVQIGHALVRDTDFVNKMKEDEKHHSACKRSNFCVAHMYTYEMRCHECKGQLPEKLRKEIKEFEDMWYPEENK